MPRLEADLRPPPAAVPGASARDPCERAAWLYYMEALTQAAIAQAMGVTRARVIALLAQARERGIVRVRIHGATRMQRELEAGLAARFGLAEAVVAPAPADARRTARVVGYAAGCHLADRLAPGATLAVGWGATLHAALAAVPPAVVPARAVVSLLGGALEARGVTAFEVARRLAATLGADCYPLNAPLYVADARVHAALWADPAVREVRTRSRAADVALLSVGDVSEGATLLSAGFVPRAAAAELRALGAVGDVLGHFVDVQGAIVAHDVNRRVMAVDLQDLARGPRVIVASGGRRKVAALRAVLRALPVSVLVTDETAARGLLLHD